MLVKTEGIVLGQIPFSESSLIVKIYTREYGVLSFLLKGIKGKTKGKAQVFNPINQLELSFYQREAKSLKSIKEYNLLFAPDAQSFGIYKTSVATMMVELLRNTLPDQAPPDEHKYDFIIDSLNYLRTMKLNANFYLSFMFQYSSYLGIDIPLDSPLHSPQILLALSGYDTAALLTIDRAERKKIFQWFEQHYLENLNGYKSLKSIEIFEAIL